MSTSSRVEDMEQESQGTKRTYAQAIRRKTKPSQETRPQETTEPAQPQETRRATPLEPAPNEDNEPYLIRTRDALWTTTEDLHQTRLLKSSSAVLHFPRYSNIDAVDLINALDEIGLCSRYVKAVQRCPQPDVFNVTFHSPRIREYFLSIGRFTVNGIPALLNDSESPISFIVVKSAPAELPDAAIIARLKCFGDVLSFRRCKHYGTGIENGTRTARMRLRTPIPSYVRIASETLYVYYTGQARTCRRCNRTGHEARNCNNFACFNCDELGHVASACSDSLRCSICKSTGHKANHCPFAVIDALNEKQSITTSLVHALESVPPSIASSSDDETSHHNDKQEGDGDTENILEDADALQQYLTSSEQPLEEPTEETTQPPSPESTASTVISSVAQSTPVNTPFLFSTPTSPDTQFASGSKDVTVPPPEQPAIPTAKPPPVTKKPTTKPGTHKLPPTITAPTRRNTVRTTQRSTQQTSSPTVIPDTFTPSNKSAAKNIPGPSQSWGTLMDDDQISNYSSKRGHDDQDNQDNEGFILVRKKKKAVKPHGGKHKT